MARPPAHKWTFAARFRRHAFDWRSQPAVQRVREATAEIRNLARKDPALAAAGAVLFLEKVSPALEHVDGSCGAIGTAVNHAVEICAKIIAEAPVNDETRDRWLDRLWEAHQNDEIPYIERLTDYWGELCASNSRASAWADRLIGTVKSVWSPNRKPGDYFHGTMACLSALFHAGRHEELIALLDKPPLSLWHYREWGVRALAAMGRKAELTCPRSSGPMIPGKWLGFELLQLARVVGLQPPVCLLPPIERLLGDAELTRDVRDRHPHLHLPQHRHDLLDREPALPHDKPPSSRLGQFAEKLSLTTVRLP